MKAIILAGGLGTRLRPITYRCPKPMIPVKGRPFLEYLLNYLKNQGVRDFVLCLHYMSEKFKEYFGDGSKLGINISYAIEDKPMGTGGALKNAEKFIQGRFLVLNGDTFLTFDLRRMINYHRRCGGLGTIALVYMKSPTRYGIVGVDKDWRIISFSEKRKVDEGYINAGIYIFERKLLDYIPKGKKISLEKDILTSLVQQEKFYGFPAGGYFIDIGVPEDLYRFERDLESGVIDAFKSN